MAKWVRFISNFDWSPAEHNGRVTTAYKAGTTKFVPEPAADEAVRLGRAEIVERPPGAKANAKGGRRRVRG